MGRPVSASGINGVRQHFLTLIHGYRLSVNSRVIRGDRLSVNLATTPSGSLVTTRAYEPSRDVITTIENEVGGTDVSRYD